jgi:hypothetical protein
MDVLGILRDYSVRFEKKSDGKLQVNCPFHDDNNPSGVFDSNTGFYHCFACKTSSSIYSYLSKKLNKPKKSLYFDINSKYAKTDNTPTQLKDIERFHNRIWEHETFLEALTHREVDKELILEYRLGVEHNRISIPVYDEAGRFILRRLYLPGAVEDKVIQVSSKRGEFKNKPVLFPIDQLQYDRILLVGGEIKAIAATKVLNPHGIGVITSTEGESSWNTNLNSYFEGKTVYVGLDVDETGVEGSFKRCQSLNSVTKWIGQIELPLDKEKYPKGDINDFLREGGDLLKLINEAEQWVFQTVKEIDDTEEAEHVTLEQAVGAGSTGKKIEFTAVVSSVDLRPYSIPSKIEVKCQRGQEFCSLCNIFNNCTENNQVWDIHPERLEVMEMVGEELRNHPRVLKKAIGIPSKCLECTFEPLEHFKVEDARISQELDISSRSAERTMQIAYCIGDINLEMNESYNMKGRMYPHPKNQQASLLISEYEQTEDALSTYEPTEIEKLEIFRPKEWTVESIAEKIDDIYADIEANVTFIYERRPLHLAIDLCYHSPLLLPFINRKINGWVEILIVGDSAQGKSKTAERLMEHYGLGERVICKGATTAGLLGGVSPQGNKRFFVVWGKIPTNDRRLVILEELKGCREEVIASLTDMRSSGRAVVTKIEARSAWARTRIAAISNCRSDNTIDSYTYGTDVIKELIGSQEDVRRFDMCLLVERNEVDADRVSELEKNPPDIEHKYTADLCRELVLWAWTVKDENIKFENLGTLFDVAKDLCADYVDDIPIVDRFSMKEKLAKLSAALAVRTCSNVGKGLYIRDCHIHFIAKYLRNIYNAPHFGYDKYSNTVKKSETIVNPALVIQRIKDRTKHPQDFVEHCLIAEEIDRTWIQDLLGWDDESARGLLSFLRRQRALKQVPGKRSGTYRKTSSYTNLLKQISENGVLKSANKPDYVKDDPEEF